MSWSNRNFYWNTIVNNVKFAGGKIFLYNKSTFLLSFLGWSKFDEIQKEHGHLWRLTAVQNNIWESINLHSINLHFQFMILIMITAITCFNSFFQKIYSSDIPLMPSTIQRQWSCNHHFQHSFCRLILNKNLDWIMSWKLMYQKFSLSFYYILGNYLFYNVFCARHNNLWRKVWCIVDNKVKINTSCPSNISKF